MNPDADLSGGYGAAVLVWKNWKSEGYRTNQSIFVLKSSSAIHGLMVAPWRSMFARILSFIEHVWRWNEPDKVPGFIRVTDKNSRYRRGIGTSSSVKVQQDCRGAFSAAESDHFVKDFHGLLSRIQALQKFFPRGKCCRTYCGFELKVEQPVVG